MSEAEPIQRAAFVAPCMISEMIPHSAQRLTERMRSELEAGRATELAHQAHELKGISAQLGADRLPTLCAELEVRARQGIFEDAAERVREIETEVARVEVALRSLAARQ